MEILLYRSVRTEEMGYVVEDVRKYFGENIKISILTRPEQKITMEAIPGIKKVYTYSNHIFEYSSEFNSEIKILRDTNFDLVVIPTTGNFESYQNIVKFSKIIFGIIKTKFYKYPNTFIDVNKNIIQVSYSNFLKLLSFLLTIPLICLFSLYALITSFFIQE